MKSLEEMSASFGRNAWPVIGHAQLDAARDIARGESQPAITIGFFLSLNAVEAEVEQDLTCAIRISDHRVGRRLEFLMQDDISLLCFRRDQIEASQDDLV